MHNRRLDLTGLAKPGESHRFTGMGPDVDRQEAAGQVFGRFWNLSDLSFWSKPWPRASVSNRSKFPGRFRQRLIPQQQPAPLEMGRVHHQKPGISSVQF